ncbi:beta-ketoacyl synthase domain-containing protein [Xylaria intraflava]|nr:beta-ketoacyl synthase domain-containing protein [Xylaria intraflava]
MDQQTEWTKEPVAITGIGCRFPGGANSPSKLWQLLKDPPDLLKEIPPSRFNVNGFYHPNGTSLGTTNVKHSYLLDEDYTLFDHEFFKIHPREAESMDPQQRILMEVVYEGLESAGYTLEALRGSSTAVFVGQMMDDYYDLVNRDVETAPQYTSTGTCRAIMANRVSYFFDWHGASVSIDTACSSSLVALHHAVQTLRNGESQVAVVAGVNLTLGPEKYIYESTLGMLSPTGRSRMWDASADGYARGEAFAALVVKPLSKALADGDHIEAIIRETGVNQDGRSAGLTVPSPSAQTALIESTYRRAGLDCRKKEDRCQFFEAHGTGTLAGDPKEAEAIRNAFFPTGNDNVGNESLMVGSIKTIMGHSEGTAGLAGVIRAVLSLKSRSVPPNMHFNELNPAIRPFFDNLKVPVCLEPWPTVPKGEPRRASVNSFGFGGTNAHAIIESWDVEASTDDSNSHSSDKSTPYGPFVFSAKSPHDLASVLSMFSDSFKSETTPPNLQDLAWTLQTRRDHFPFRKAISATRIDELTVALDAATSMDSSPTKAREVSSVHPARILGIFTGQGAQWPQMGARLYLESECFKNSICSMQDSLNDLRDGPSWVLADELLAPSSSSRVGLAEIAQPLCTAVQLALVDLLRASSVTFSGTVGHSSGEIAAAYAAGHLHLQDAIRIAYYRGVHSKLVRQDGSMMAVGMSYNSAQDFCANSKFRGRIQVAASNSQSSVTMSGDTRAIDDAKLELDMQKVFARKLKVDKAYHSDHMTACAEAYLNSLRQCGITNREQLANDCVWYSSVWGSDGRRLTDLNTIKDTYWIDNLVKPVLFSQSLARAVQEGQSYDLVVEVGPHPALKGPASDTIRTLTGVDIPYGGTLQREVNDMIAFSNCLGFVWANINAPDPLPDFGGFAQACSTIYKPRVCPDLPRYKWNHDRPMMRESRMSKSWRTRSAASHELLGIPNSIGGGREVRWRKTMILSEMQWLNGHRFQGQVLFPAAGYISMAAEAVRHMAQSHPIRLTELRDMNIHRAITLDAESSGVEVTFIVRITHEDIDALTLEYSCYSADVDATWNQNEQLNFDGQAVLYRGIASNDEIPPRRVNETPLVDVNLDGFYSWMSKVGLDYSGDFLVDSLSRRLGFSTVTMSRASRSTLQIHPATLDASFHGLFGAFCYPEDDRMWTAYLPTKIRRVRMPGHSGGLSPMKSNKESHAYYVGDCWLRDASDKTICADVDIFSLPGNVPEVQIEGLICSSFKQPRSDEDRLLFSHTAWRKDILSGIEDDLLLDAMSIPDVPYHVLERTAFFYLRNLRQQISDSEIPGMDWHFQSSLEWAFRRLLPRIAAHQHERIRAEWETDGQALISAWETEYGHDATLQIIHAAGRAYPSIARGQIPALQVLREGDLLDRFYRDSGFMNRSNRLLGHLLGQLAHRHTKLNVLEVGGGTGGTTANALEAAAGSLESYTFTDISAGFFEKAADKFSKHCDQMVYKTLDISNDPLQQGFQEHSFDVLIAANVLHATQNLQETMENCRKLLRPGGYLLLLEITSDTLWVQFAFSTLPGWWLGQDEGRMDCPTISRDEWNSLLLRTGYSGTQLCYSDTRDDLEYTVSVMVSQATNPVVDFLRSPLEAAPGNKLVKTDEVVIVGGKSESNHALVQEAAGLLGRFAINMTIVDGLEDLSFDLPRLGSAVVCLAELEEATWRDMTEEKFAGIKAIFDNASRIVWATRGARADNPFASMMIGLARSVTQESPHIGIQFVDFDDSTSRGITPAASSPATVLSQLLLQMLCRDLLEARDILWTDETEVMVDGNSLLIPRIVPTVEPNDRINCGRRVIEHSVSTRDYPIMLTSNAEPEIMATPSTNVPGVVEVRTDYCSAVAFQTRDGSKFWIALGSSPTWSGDKPVFALLANNASTSLVRSHQLFEPSLPQQTPMTLLREIISSLFCEYLFSGLSGALWLHDADEYLSDTASEYAVRLGVQLLLTASSEKQDRAVFLHRHAPERVLRSLVPRDVQRLAILKEQADPSLLHLVQSTGYAMDILGADKLLKFGTVIPLHLDDAELSNTISRVIHRPLSCSDSSPTILRADELAATRSLVGPLSLITWAGVDKILVRTRPINTQGLFSSQKTYFLVGLTGEVGLSLCEWMVKNGARYLAITSRNPRISPQALDHLRGISGGVTINVFSLDISDEKALHEVHHQITTTMPPIAGVANAAMVLRDKPFAVMSLEDFECVLAPKVRGSENLDRLFHSSDLDFFILFSSLSRVVGNAGQSNYAAANMYMTSLINQRRRRGVVGSVIDLAMLVGLGYIHNLNNASLESQMRQAGYMALSEPDLHTIFAEAIHAGRPDSLVDPVLQTGLSMSASAPWSHIPRLSHMASSNKHLSKSKNRETEGSEASLWEKLAATSDEETLPILQAEFCKKLSMMLRIDVDEIVKDAPLVSLGIDSLVAVELRSWCLHEFTIDLPVLQILGGASLVDICLEVRRSVRERLLSERNTKEASIDTSLPGHSDTSVVETQTSSSPDLFTFPSRLDSGPISLSETRDVSPRRLVESELEILLPSNDSDFKAAHSRVGPMSHSQEALYFLHQYLGDKSSQNVSYHGVFQGPVDRQRFESALWNVCNRHESLRSSYFLDPTTYRPVQAVNNQPRIKVIWKEIRDESSVDGEIGIARNHTFRIEEGESMKAVVLSPASSPLRHHIVFVHHHIVLDAMAWFFFLRELDWAYSGKQFQSPVQQAIDAATIRRAKCAPEKLTADLDFWREMHQERIDPLPLFPFCKTRNRQTLAVYDHETVEIPLGSEFCTTIRKAAAALHVTQFHFFLATLSAFLGRCLRIDALNIGMVDANRADPDTATAMGSYLNLLPLQLRIDRDESFTNFARRTRDRVVSCMAHSLVPFEMILEELKVPRSSDHHPLFQVLVNYRLGFSNETPLGPGKIEWIGGLPSKNTYDLEVDITTSSGGSGLLSVTGQKYLFGQSDLKYLLKWYCRALEGYAQNPDNSIRQCPTANEEDTRQALELGKGPRVNIEWQGTLIHQVERMVHRYPDAVAVKHGDDESLTYSAMMSRVIQISLAIQAEGLTQPGEKVGMLLDPGADAICCLLAVMRSGLVWVPLDLRNHIHRLLSIASESGLSLIVCSKNTVTTAQQLAVKGTKILCLTLDQDSPPPNQQTDNLSDPTQDAALLYTSGSTGTPKGVKIGHQALLNQIFVNKQLFNVQREVVLQQTSYGFDIVFDQIFQALANGGVLVVVSQQGRGDPLHLAQLMVKESITYTHVVPSEYQMMLQYGEKALKTCASWRIAMAAGEKITQHLRKGFQTLGLNHVQLVNAYGPTECTVTCARGEIPYRTNSDVASPNDYLRPLPNYELLIMSPDDMTVAPIGFPGELCVRGVGTARGYTNNTEETQRKFIGADEARLYRTGDSARMLEDGTITILGRIEGDTQVKIRGMRIELDEIAATIVQASHGIIRDAAAVWKPERQLLAAFVVFAPGFAGDAAEYIERLRRVLPLAAYMRPSYIAPVAHIPSNANGKQDRAALNSWAIENTPTGGRQISLHDPSQLTDMQQRMLVIWKAVIHHHSDSLLNADATTDFFHVGGNSTLLVELRMVVASTFAVQIKLSDLFQSSTLGGMVDLITSLASVPQELPTTSWVRELETLCANIPEPLYPISPMPDRGAVVLLTGSTGFLGRALLQRLVEDIRVAEVHCIAVRPQGRGRTPWSQDKPARHQEKVFEYPGDLGDPELGLSAIQFQTLRDKVNVIIHNGAQVSFLKAYGTLRQVNVLSTKTLLHRLAVPHRVPLHFVSTASVATVIESYDDDGQPLPLPEVSVSAHTPPLDSAHGYRDSKWVSESLLERAQKDTGTPVWIHRPTTITGPEAPDLDLVAAILKYSRLLGSVPLLDSRLLKGRFDLVAVGNVAADIVEAALSSSSGSASDVQSTNASTATTFIHHCNGVSFRPEDLGLYLESIDGTQFDVVELRDWLESALKRGLSPLIHDFMLDAFHDGGQVTLPVLARAERGK